MAVDAAEARIRSALEALATDGASAAREAATGAAKAFARAAEAVLPALAEAGFGETAAETVSAILSEGRPETLAISTHPADRAAVEHALASRATPALAIADDATLAPGELHLAWADGGAELDRDRMVRAVLARLEADLGLPART